VARTYSFIHLYFAVRGLSTGFALPELVKWLAWRIAAPADCPDCGNRLQPSSLPSIPWLVAVRKVKFQLPDMSQVKAPQWKAPAWWLNRGANDDDEDAPLFRDNEETRYRDDPEATGESSTRVEEPEEVAIVGKRDKKARDAATAAAATSGEANWQD
jgi:hypothetical protein